MLISKVNGVLKCAFPFVMVTICLLTVFRYASVREFRERSVPHGIVVESENIDAVEEALRGATFQPVNREKISENKYLITVRCPPESMGGISKIINRLGAKQVYENRSL